MRLSSQSTSRATIDLPSVVTTVVWLVFTSASVMGLRLQYQQAHARAKEKPPVTAEQMDVKMIGTAQTQTPRSDPSPVPQESIADSLPQIPSLEPVAEPSPEIPFAVPVHELPRRIQISSPVVSPIQHLILGTGEGDKPPPEYPREAKIAHQQGAVTVQFSVDENGHVTEAEAIAPSPYPLLNQAAVRAVRDTWIFPTGKTRTYDVNFQFELHQK